MICRKAFGAAFLAGLASLAGSGVWAQSPAEQVPQAGLVPDIMNQQTLLGDIGGLRPWLLNYGATLSITETSEVLGNLTGGIRRGFEYDGLTTMTFQLDTARAFGLPGGTFNASALQIHGRNLSADNLDDLQTASGIEADRATRLWELWYQQKFWNGLVDVKIGQQSLDQEFMDSTNAALFVNTMMGWPAVPSYDMPGGGPAYPLSAPGIRLRAHPTDSLTFLAGVFNGSPSPDNNIPDSQVANPSGTSFPLNGGVLAIAELQYAYPANGAMVMPGQPPALPRTYRLGFWYDSEDFGDLAYDTNGLSLASNASNGIPLSHHGDYGLYAVFDQMVWQSAEETDKSVSVFGRFMGTPESDRNLIDFALNLGVTFHNPLPHRNDDTFGVGLGYVHVSSQQANLDNATNALGVYTPAQSGETFLEVTYQLQAAPWWQIQPDFQYVFNPGGGVANPLIPNQKVRNEAIIGVRTNITF